MKRSCLLTLALLLTTPLFGQTNKTSAEPETRILEQIVTPRQVAEPPQTNGFAANPVQPPIVPPVFRPHTATQHDPFLLVADSQTLPPLPPQNQPAFSPLQPLKLEQPAFEKAAIPSEQGTAAFLPLEGTVQKRLPVETMPNDRELRNTPFPPRQETAAFTPPRQNTTAAPAARQEAAVARNYQLRNIGVEAFEKKLLDKLGKRFVPVQNVENTSGIVRFRLPSKDGNALDLTVERQTGVITAFGSAPMCDSCLRIVQLLDTQDASAEFVPVQKANIAALKRAGQILNQQTQAAPVNPQVAQNVPAAPQANPQTNPQATPEEQADAVNPENPGGAVVGPVQVDVIDGLETLVIKGPPKDVEVIKAIIAQLETMSLEHEPIIELVPMKYGDSYRVSQMVQQLYQQVYLARRGSLTFVPLVKPNTILLIGKRESLDTAKELIGKLDRPVRPDRQFKIFRLKHASSDTLQTEITTFYNNTNQLNTGLEARVYVVSDSATNALIIQANPRDMTEVAALIAKLDVNSTEALNQVKTFALKNAIASELATTLQNAFSTGTTGTGFGGAGAQNNRTRAHELQMTTVNGETIRANVLYDVKVTADTRSNSLIVSAPEKSMPLIEAIITQLDQLPAAEAQIKVFTLVNGDASTLATVLTNLFSQNAAAGGGLGGGAQGTSQIATVRPGIEEGESTLVSVRIQAETRTNSILACGSAGDMAIIEALLIRLDEENANNRKVMMIKLINTKAEDIAAAVQNYATQERQVETQNSGTYYPQSPAEQYRKEIVIVPETISNSLIISTTLQHYERIRKIVRELDERQLMVSMQVLIAEVRLTGNREEGIEIGLQDSLFFDRSTLSSGGNGAAGALSPGFLFGNPALGLPLGNVNSDRVGTQGVTSLGTGRVGANGVGGFTFSASSESVSVLVRALETQGKLRVLSRPQLTTTHNNRATIKVGQDVPYVTALNNSNYNGDTNSSVNYREVGTILDITPRITPDGRVILSVYVEKSSVSSSSVAIGGSGGTAINSPIINITNAQTVVSANDNETIVFAGLITEEKENIERSVPYLNKIPVVKNFFQYKSTNCVRSELLIVMTPTIIRSETDAAMIRQQEASRMHWCISDVVKMTGNSKMQIRGDYIDTDTNYIHPAPVIIDEKLLPSEEKIRPMLPVPTLAPER